MQGIDCATARDLAIRQAQDRLNDSIAAVAAAEAHKARLVEAYAEATNLAQLLQGQMIASRLSLRALLDTTPR